MKVYNGNGMVLGRMATLIAKELLLGEQVVVINSEKVCISGDKSNAVKENLAKMARRGYPLKSAKISRLPDRYVRRVIRGMLPWKTSRGREAFKRLMCYTGMPEEFKEVQPVKIDLKSSVKKLPTLKYITVEKLCEGMGGKIKESA
jgi:large subunit ribosomal protein L13